jgi:hypothetical protein
MERRQKPQAKIDRKPTTAEALGATKQTAGNGSQDRLFTASQVAEFEYCPLAWWYEQFEPMAQADTEEQFARLVELEHEHSAQAPALPEYQVVEQLLARKGAFDEGREQHIEHAEEVEEAENIPVGMTTTQRMRVLTVVIAVILVIALLLIVAALVVR